MDTIPPQIRARFRQAIPELVLDQVRAAAISSLSRQREPGIPLNDFVVLEDLRQPWIRETPQRLIASLLLARARVDAQNPNAVRKPAVRLGALAGPVADLLAFLKLFDSEVLVLIPACEDILTGAHTLMAALTESDDARAAAAASDFTLMEPLLSEYFTVIAALPHLTIDVLGIEPPWGDAHIEHLFGIPAPARTRRFGRRNQRPADIESYGRSIAERQLPYLLPFGQGMFDDPYVGFAIRIATSDFPLLAHRLLLLTTRLLERAADVDEQKTNSFLMDFFIDEASWIMSAGPRFEDAIAAYGGGDRPAIIDAYRRLSEGVLRPYGSLICAISEIATGSSPPASFAVEPFLSDLEHRFKRNADEPVCQLLASFVETELRNADAHARAAVGGAGDLLVRQLRGGVETVNANHVWGTTKGLRSALDGVDSAVNIYWATRAARSVTPTAEQLSRRVFTEAMVEFLARQVADLRTDGAVQSVRMQDRTLTVVFEGSATEDALSLMTRQLAYLCRGDFDRLLVTRDDGTVLYTLLKVPAE